MNSCKSVFSAHKWLVNHKTTGVPCSRASPASSYSHRFLSWEFGSILEPRLPSLMSTLHSIPSTASNASYSQNTTCTSLKLNLAHLRRRPFEHFWTLSPFCTLTIPQKRSEKQGFYPAQRPLRKIDRLLDLLELAPGDQVLEVGCGWGSLAIRCLGLHDVACLLDSCYDMFIFFVVYCCHCYCIILLRLLFCWSLHVIYTFVVCSVIPFLFAINEYPARKWTSMIVKRDFRAAKRFPELGGWTAITISRWVQFKLRHVHICTMSLKHVKCNRVFIVFFGPALFFKLPSWVPNWCKPPMNIDVDEHCRQQLDLARQRDLAFICFASEHSVFWASTANRGVWWCKMDTFGTTFGKLRLHNLHILYFNYI